MLQKILTFWQPVECHI